MVKSPMHLEAVPHGRFPRISGLEETMRFFDFLKTTRVFSAICEFQKSKNYATTAQRFLALD
jgi:hypothetical protein